MPELSTAELFSKFASGYIGKNDLLFERDDFLPGMHICIPLSDVVQHETEFSMRDSFVWVPKVSADRALNMLSLQVKGGVAGCNIIITRTNVHTKLSLTIWGRGHTVMLLSERPVQISGLIGGVGSAMVVGEGTSIVSGEVNLRNCAFTVCAGGLWSDQVLIQGGNQHGIYDTESMDVSYDPPSRIVLDRHVWLGRRSIVTKGVHIGAGSIAATGAVVTKNVPPLCSVGGNPSRIIRQNVSWGDNDHDRMQIEKIKSSMGGMS